MLDADVGSETAPTYRIPQNRIVSIEHPCIIKNFHNGLKSLGGEQQLRHVLDNQVGDSKNVNKQNGVEPVAGVSLRLGDPLAKKLASTATETGNVLIRVTLPARTGRKRKRGSDGPYKGPADGAPLVAKPVTAPGLLQRMREHGDKCTVEALGIITDTHRFNTLPDFQLRTDDMPIMQELRSHALNPDYTLLKSFKPPTGPIILPPPTFIPLTAPPPPYKPPHEPKDTTAPRVITRPRTARGRIFNIYPNNVSERAYAMYSTSNLGPPPQLRALAIPYTTREYPTAPPPDLAPPEPGTPIYTIRKRLTELLEERPLITRRTYWVLLAGHRDPNIRRTIPHCAYYLITGPWRFSITRYGVDPRSDPSLRVYQTVSYSKACLKTITSGSAYGEPSKSIRYFDGKTMMDPSETWSLRDWTQPILAKLIHESPVRDGPPDDQWGFYYNGTLAKVIVLARDMMIQLSTPNRPVILNDAAWQIIAALPDRISRPEQCLLDRAHLSSIYGEAVTRHLCVLAEAVADEALVPTFCGIRGYEEVEPVNPQMLKEMRKGPDAYVNGKRRIRNRKAYKRRARASDRPKSGEVGGEGGEESDGDDYGSWDEQSEDEEGEEDWQGDGDEDGEDEGVVAGTVEDAEDSEGDDDDGGRHAEEAGDATDGGEATMYEDEGEDGAREGGGEFSNGALFAEGAEDSMQQ